MGSCQGLEEWEIESNCLVMAGFLLGEMKIFWEWIEVVID